MPDRNAYLQYKHETSRLIYWLIQTSNKIVASASSSTPLAPASSSSQQASKQKVTTPAITLSTLLRLSKIVSESSPRITVPASIYRLFESVIAARARAAHFYERIVTEAGKQDVNDVEESNTRHQAFLRMLETAFEVLGGEEWKKNKKELEEEVGEEEEGDDVWINRFASLYMNDATQADDEDEDVIEPGGKENTARPKKKGKGKGKGGKGKGKGKKKPAKKVEQPEPKFEDTPLESYKIIDGDGLVTEYLLAVYSIIQEMVELRNYTKGIWERVVEGKLHSAAAGVMSNMAIAVVKQLQFEVASDFPGNGSFDAILNTITRGDPDKAQGMFKLGLLRIDELTGDVEPAVPQIAIDVKECFMAHAYWDLCAFIEDYQKNRTSKPTKAMLAKLNNWDPNFDLKTSSRQKRTEWRTAYTINWLYDFVNLYTSVVMQRKNGVGPSKTPEPFVLENVDWTEDGKWSEHRVLWGPTDFAADITALAMSKPSPAYKERIMPHHVFQMQCMVDSFMVSKGWQYYPLKGHVISTPHKDFDPRHDLKHFQWRPRRGINYSIDLLMSLLKHDGVQNGNLNRHKIQLEMLPLIREDLNIWLGDSKLTYGLNSLPPSRFANSNPNGLWEYSPFLCGTGLADALEFVYNYSMASWDKQPEPTAILHLYNMLRKTGHIRQPIDVFDQVLDIFRNTLFIDGELPKRAPDFLTAWKSCAWQQSVLGVPVRRQIARRTQIGTTPGKGVFSETARILYKRKSLLTLLKGTSWRPEKIVDADLPTYSLLNGMRLAREDAAARASAKRNSNPFPPAIPKPPLANEVLSSTLGLSSPLTPGGSANFPPEIAAKLRSAFNVPDDYKIGPINAQSNTAFGALDPLQMNNRGFLECVQRDVVSDICGNISPLSGISYLHLLAMFMLMFMEFEREGQHLLAIREAYGRGAYPCIALVTCALHASDDQLLEYLGKKMVEAAGELGCGEFSYWPIFVNVFDLDNVRNDEKLQRYRGNVSKDDVGEQCVLM